MAVVMNLCSKFTSAEPSVYDRWEFKERNAMLKSEYMEAVAFTLSRQLRHLFGEPSQPDVMKLAYLTCDELDSLVMPMFDFKHRVDFERWLQQHTKFFRQEK